MLKLTICNVGQGDGIIINWKSDIDSEEYDKYAIIDCNNIHNRKTHNGQKFCPISHYLEQNNVREIDFILISHPHTDHFSGILPLIELCEQKGISIKYIYHTMSFTSIYGNTLPWPVRGKEHESKLIKLLHKLDQINKNRTTKVRSICNTSAFSKSLNAHLSLRFLSPTDEELSNYRKQTKTYDFENYLYKDAENNPDANLLSSVTQIFTDDWYILLTSDAPRSVLKRLQENSEERVFKDKKIIVAQIPNHGSINNHDQVFWDNCESLNNAVTFISAGEKYDYPSEEVVEYFYNKSGYLIGTNFVNGFETFFNKEEAHLRKVNNALFSWTDIKQLSQSLQPPNFGTHQIEIAPNGAYHITQLPF